MKAVMLAAGRGTRLSGFDETHVPKSLLRFGGQTLLARHLAALPAPGFPRLVQCRAPYRLHTVGLAVRGGGDSTVDRRLALAGGGSCCGGESGWPTTSGFRRKLSRNLPRLPQLSPPFQVLGFFGHFPPAGLDE